MPTPLEIVLDPVSMILLAIYAALMLSEAIFPARKLPYIKYWRIKGILFFFIFFYLSTYLPLWYAACLPSTPLFDINQWGTAAGILAGVLLYELGMYVWHWSMHRNHRLWKVFHQMHHSAERLDTYGAFYFSPWDMIGFTLLGTVCFSLLLGVTPQSTTAILLITNFLSMFQHANIRTPVWLGYIIQRPESHAVHHARGIHAYNYSDLPLFDILFGTFRNPEKYIKETGFYDGASQRMKEMLLGKEVDKPA
jgi:sterol desaturase/sphingolipid hydroxylase (fatty acid hydroxylase superfamily)